MGNPPPLLYALRGSEQTGARVADALGIRLAPHEEREFEDGEHKARPLSGVRGRDAYVLHGLFGDAQRGVDQRLCRLLFFIATLKDAGARSVTAITPYLAYARKDRRTKERDPVTLRYVAQLFEAVGTDRLVALEAHNTAAFDNAFRLPVLHLDADETFADALAAQTGDAPLAIASPDTGGIKRAQRLQQRLAAGGDADVPLAFVHKHRSEGVVSGGGLVGEVRGRVVVLVDDLIVTGTTLMRATAACRAGGAQAVIAVATHGLFAPGAEPLFGPAGPDRVLITDSVPARMEAKWQGRVQCLPVAPLLADAVRRLHANAAETPP